MTETPDTPETDPTAATTPAAGTLRQLSPATAGPRVGMSDRDLPTVRQCLASAAICWRDAEQAIMHADTLEETLPALPNDRQWWSHEERKEAERMLLLEDIARARQEALTLTTHAQTGVALATALAALGNPGQP